MTPRPGGVAEVAIQIDEYGARNVTGEVLGAAGARISERPSDVCRHHRRVPEVVNEPLSRNQRSHRPMKRLIRLARTVTARLTTSIEVIGMNTVHRSPSIRMSPGSRPNHETRPGAKVITAPTRAIPIPTTMRSRPRGTSQG